jgi:outer membrane protein assembly factor BamB
MNTRLWMFLSVCLAAFTRPAWAADWPQWRGPERSGVSKETGLLKVWPKKGPRWVWTYKNAGIGFSGPAVVDNRLYTLGARGETEYLFALDVKTGEELWHTKVGAIFTFKGNSYGDGPRSTPTVDGKWIYALGGMGDLVCVEKDKGKEKWRTNLVNKLGGSLSATAGSPAPIGWGFSEGPLVDGDQLVCTPGGKQGTLAALNKKTGEVLWRSEKLTDDATYSSLVPTTVGGIRQYVVLTYRGTKGGAVAGVEAKTGNVLWEYPQPHWDVTAIVPTPLVQDASVYVSVGYGAGCDLLQLSTRGRGPFQVKQVYKKRNRRTMKNEFGGVVRVGKYLYGHSDKIGWVCQDWGTGKSLWESKQLVRGSLIAADGHLYLFSDEGTAVLIEASPKGYSESGRFDIPEKSKLGPARKGNSRAKIWTPPVIADGRLFLRDQEYLFCYDVRQK